MNRRTLGKASWVGLTLVVLVALFGLVGVYASGSGEEDGVVGPLAAPATPRQLFFDSFESGLGNWVQDAQNGWQSSTARAAEGIRSAEVDGFVKDALLVLKNAINLSGMASASLSFSWFNKSSVDVGEGLGCDLWNGKAWVGVAGLWGDVDPENAWQSRTVDLSGYLRSDFKVRFRGRMSLSDEDAYVDIVKIVGTPAPAPTPTPTPTPAPPAADVFAVGENGTILRYNGSDWTPMSSSTSATLHAVWGSSCSDVFAVGSGIILHYDGNAWSPMVSDIPYGLVGVWGSSSTDVFAVGAGFAVGPGSPAVLHYNGGNWSPMGIPQGIQVCLNGVWGTSACDVFAVANKGGIIHYDGLNWHAMSSGTSAYLYDVWGTAHNDVFAIGSVHSDEEHGQCLHYDGTSWQVILDAPVELHAVGGTASNNVFAVGNWGTIMRYNGTDWSPMTSGTDAQLKGVWASSPSNVFAVGCCTRFLHYNGSAWGQVGGAAIAIYDMWGCLPPEPVPAPQPCCTLTIGADGCGTTDPATGTHSVACATDVWLSATPCSNGGFANWIGPVADPLCRWTHVLVNSNMTVGANFTPPPATEVFAVGEGGAALHYSAGPPWGATASGTDTHLYGVWGTSHYNILAAGEAGIWHYNGSAWSPVDIPTSSALDGVWGTSACDVFAVGANGTIIHYDGSIWSAMTSGTQDDLHAVWGTSHNDVFAVGDNETTLHYDGSVWEEMANENLGYRLFSVWGSSHNDVYAVGEGGRILRYDGAVWLGASIVETDLLGVWGTSWNDVFAVGVGGLILHYQDGAWSQMHCVGLENDLYAIWGRSHSDVYAVGQGGLILHYNGSTWNQMANGDQRTLRGVWGPYPPSPAPTPLPCCCLTVRVNGCGMTDPLPGTYCVACGSVMPVRALDSWEDLYPDECRDWEFAGWTGDVAAPSLHDTEVTLNGSKTVTAHFVPPSTSEVFAVGGYQLEADGDAGGQSVAQQPQGDIIHYDGTSWSWMNPGEVPVLRDVWGPSPTDVFAVGDEGTILHYDGGNWSAMASGTSTRLNGVWGSSSSDVFAVGDAGTIVHYDGGNWSAMASGIGGSLKGVWGTKHNDVFAVGWPLVLKSGAPGDGASAQGGVNVLHYDGVGWSAMGSGFEGGFNAVWGTAWNDVFAVGWWGHIFHYDGTAWSGVLSPVERTIYGVWGSSHDDVFAVGQWDTVLHYNGSAWSQSQMPVLAYVCDYHDVWGSAHGDVFTVGRWGSVLHYNGGAWDWPDACCPTQAELYGVWGFSGAPPPTPTPRPTPTPTPVPGPTAVFLDSFEDCTLANWVQDTQGAWSCSTQRAVAPGTYSAEVDGYAANAALTLRNPVNLSGASSASLSFSWFIESGLDLGEYLACDLWNGTTWVEVARLRGDVDPENTWDKRTVDLAGYLRSDFKLRFRGTMSMSDEDANVDVVKIMKVGGPAPTPAPTPTPTPRPTPTPTPLPPGPTPTTAPTSLFFDSFEAGLGNWAQDAQKRWTCSALRARDATHSAEVDGYGVDAALTLKNPIDLSGMASASLNFSWYITNSLDIGEYLACDVWNGTSWVEVLRLRGDVDIEDMWHSRTVDLAGYLRSDFKVRFRGTMSLSGEDANVDAVRIAGIPAT